MDAVRHPKSISRHLKCFFFFFRDSEHWNTFEIILRSILLNTRSHFFMLKCNSELWKLCVMKEGFRLCICFKTLQRGNTNLIFLFVCFSPHWKAYVRFLNRHLLVTSCIITSKSNLEIRLSFLCSAVWPAAWQSLTSERSVLRDLLISARCMYSVL